MKIIATCFWKMLYHYQCNDVVGVLGYKKKSFSGGYDKFVRLIIGLLTGRINVEYFFFAARLERNSRNRMKKVFKNDSTSPSVGRWYGQAKFTPTENNQREE